MVHGSLFIDTGHGIHVNASIVQLLIDALSQNNVENTSALIVDDVTQLTMAEFDKTCTSPTTQLWLMYMDMVIIVKRYTHAERAGLWEEHLGELENMLLYLVDTGHCKYVSCLPHYIEAMIGLPTLALNILKAFKMHGHIIVRQTEAQFNGVWRDMTLENTYNRDAKTKLSTDIIHQLATMVKYWRALTVLTAESEQTKAMPHLDLDDTKHHEDTNRQAEKRA